MKALLRDSSKRPAGVQRKMGLWEGILLRDGTLATGTPPLCRASHSTSQGGRGRGWVAGGPSARHSSAAAAARELLHHARAQSKRLPRETLHSSRTRRQPPPKDTPPNFRMSPPKSSTSAEKEKGRQSYGGAFFWKPWGKPLWPQPWPLHSELGGSAVGCYTSTVRCKLEGTSGDYLLQSRTPVSTQAEPPRATCLGPRPDAW